WPQGHAQLRDPVPVRARCTPQSGELKSLRFCMRAAPARRVPPDQDGSCRARSKLESTRVEKLLRGEAGIRRLIEEKSRFDQMRCRARLQLERGERSPHTRELRP